MHDPMGIFSESVIFTQWASFFFFFRFLVQRLPAIEIDSVESTISKAYRSTCRMRHRRPVEYFLL